MKKEIYLIIILLIFIGCSDRLTYLDVNSNGECIILCNKETKKYLCDQSIITYTAKNQFNNNEFIFYNKSCECVSLDCLKT